MNPRRILRRWTVTFTLASWAVFVLLWQTYKIPDVDYHAIKQEVYPRVWQDVQQHLQENLQTYGIDTIVYGPIMLFPAHGVECRLSHLLIVVRDAEQPALQIFSSEGGIRRTHMGENTAFLPQTLLPEQLPQDGARHEQHP